MAYLHRKKDTKEKDKLANVFRDYAQQGSLDKKQLAEAFQHLGAQLPKMQAEEAMSVAQKNSSSITIDTNEFNYLVEYAYNKGFKVYDF